MENKLIYNCFFFDKLFAELSMHFRSYEVVFVIA